LAPLSAALVVASGARAADPCTTLGSPSYTADRRVSVGGRAIEGKVFVSGSMMREETTIDGRRLVRVTNTVGGGFIYYPDKREMMEVPTPQVTPPEKGKNRVTRENGEGGSVVLKIEFQRDGKWIEIGRTVCRPDGVLLSQDLPAPTENDISERVKITQSNITIGPVDPNLFKRPSDARTSPR
jgi:hypothetical protein